MADSFQARRAKAAGEDACCKRGNILLFVLIGFVMFYATAGGYMYAGPGGAGGAETQTRELVDTQAQPQPQPRGSVSDSAAQAQLRGGGGAEQSPPIPPAPPAPKAPPAASTVAADGIDDGVTAVVHCSTSQGNLTVDVRGGWAPLGAEQYLKLVEEGLFTDLPFFRVCPRYISKCTATDACNAMHCNAMSVLIYLYELVYPLNNCLKL
jgi:hypothetical protein